MTGAPDPLFTRVARALAVEYELVRLLGRGGMATVFLARERALKRHVAIKVLDPELGASPVFRARFAREAETAGQLQHPNIVPIFRVGEADGVAYYAMGYVEGESLAERLQRDGRLSLADALRVAREVADALASAHRRGIVHRDVKPQNILLEKESGRALVTDFGIARAALDAGAGEDRLTALGLVMGTPRYMSPEQAAGERDVTSATDLYALGVVWYEMLTGAYPYRIPGSAGPMAVPFSYPVVPVRERGGEIPAGLAGIVDQLLAQDPAQRPASGEVVVRAIDAATGTGALTAARPARRPLSRRVKLIAAASVAFAIGLPAFLWFVRPGAPPRGVDPRKSMLIGFFENTTRDPGIEWLRVGGVELLSQSLKRWSDLQVVDVERLLDLARRKGVDQDAALSRDDAVRLARGAGVWTTTVGSLLRLGDRVRITVRVYDVTTSRQLTQASIESRPDSTLPQAFASLADQILDVSGAQRASLHNVEPPTRSLTAYQAYVEGVAARSRWDLPQAIAAFQRAVQADSTFALAYYELSQAHIPSEFFAEGAKFVALADSALHYAAGRPPRERMLIQAYHAFVHSDFPRARDLARQVLALDSTSTDAWGVLGDASWLDLNIVKDARGNDSLRSSFTTAIRSYERALALDESDHRLYGSIAQCLSGAALGGERANFPGFREPYQGPVNRFLFRVSDRIYNPVYQGDSVILVPAESMARKFPAKVLDSLRARARARMNGIMDRWLTVAPNEGQAHFLRALLLMADKQYDSADVAIDDAMRLGVASSLPLEFIKLSARLQGRRLPAAVAYVDSLAQAGRLDTLLSNGPFAAGVFVNADFLGGRLARARKSYDAVFGALRQIRMTSDQERQRDINWALIPLMTHATVDKVTPAELARAAADIEHRLTALPDSIRTAARPRIGRVIAFAAATMGDTATARRWMSATTRYHGALAWAAAAAGDRRTAEQLLAAGDTMPNVMNEFALARASELMGNTREALRHYERLDSLDYQSLGNPDTDWVLLVRSYPGRAAMYQALGDTARANDYYRRFVTLWRDADDELRPEVEKAQRALGIAPKREP